jgi:hypothetical protein
MGWDERLGAGFENPNIPESRYSYAMLSIRSWLEFGRLMEQIGETELSNKYIYYANQKMTEARAYEAMADCIRAPCFSRCHKYRPDITCGRINVLQASFP